MKKIVTYKDKTFICYVSACDKFQGRVAVWERKRPYLPIFKDSFCRTVYFFTADYNTIDAAVWNAVTQELEHQQEVDVLGSKWQSFKKTLNDPLEM